jgi:hypothetical protein
MHILIDKNSTVNAGNFLQDLLKPSYNIDSFG